MATMKLHFLAVLLVMSCSVPPQGTHLPVLEEKTQETPPENEEKPPKKKPPRTATGLTSTPPPPPLPQCPEEPAGNDKKQILKTLDCLIKIEEAKPKP